ncbi:MAG: hypothetical protein HEP71_03260 [Roseivirga sp.]|nr:hypothetical protein [Roseivirga sp.]
MLATIRTYFQVNSTSLAHYLGISPDMLKSISSGRRDWAFAPLLAANRLFDALDRTTPVAELEYARAFSEQERREDTPMLLKEIKRLERELEFAREGFDKLQELRQRCLRGLHACERLLLTNLDADKRRWLESCQRNLLFKLEENGELKVCMLRAKIGGLVAELEVLHRAEVSPGLEYKVTGYK